MILETDSMEINTDSTKSSITDFRLYKIFHRSRWFMYLIFHKIHYELFTQWDFARYSFGRLIWKDIFFLRFKIILWIKKKQTSSSL